MSFQKNLQTCQKHGSIPQLSANWVHQGKEEFSGGIGHPAHAETRYPIASITKTFTAELAVSLLNEKSISLRTPVQELVPYFAIKHPRSEHVTICDLLNHQTPLKVHLSSWVKSDLTRKEFIQQTLPNLQCYEDPEPQYRYSNIMYAVLGQIIEEVSGQCWEMYLRNNILHPLDLTQTTHIDSDWTHTPHLASPMKQTASGPVPMPPFFARKHHLIAPASELISTTHDLSIWGQHATQTNLWATHSPILLTKKRPSSKLGTLYSSIGWRHETFRDHKLYWHSGQCSGYTGILACMPDQNFTVSVLCNLNGAINSLQAMMYSVTDLALGNSEVNWFEEF